MPVKMLRIATAASGHLGVRLIETIAASGTLHPTIQTLYSPRILLLQQIRVEARQVRNLFRLLLGLLIRARRLFTSPTTTTTPSYPSKYSLWAFFRLRQRKRGEQTYRYIIYIQSAVF